MALVQGGADVSLLNAEGKTATDFAKEGGHTDIGTVLLQAVVEREEFLKSLQVALSPDPPVLPTSPTEPSSLASSLASSSASSSSAQLTARVIQRNLTFVTKTVKKHHYLQLKNLQILRRTLKRKYSKKYTMCMADFTDCD